MSTTSGGRRPIAEPGSSGRVVRNRRTALRRTPYERPTPRLSPNSDSCSPNWLSRLILSPTRMIASGAGKVLASVFDGNSSSSSSSSSSNGDSTSDDDMEDASDDNDIPPLGTDWVEKNNETSKINSPRKETPALEWKSETKRVIEQLLMQETFTREECDRLTVVIKSRVVDFPIIGGAEGQRQDVDVSDLRNTAVIEAKKWLEEKKLGSNLKSKLEYGTCTFNTAMLPYVTEVEGGSPVDLAKSYMQARPPWASPSLNQIQHSSSAPTGIHLQTPYSFGGNSVSSSKLTRDSPTSSKILEEIRSKVKTKATEDMLRARPSSKIDWSALASDYKSRPNLFLDDKVETSMEDNIHYSNQLIDAPVKLVSHVTTHSLPVSQGEGEEGLQNHVGFSNPAISNPERSQDPQAMQIIEEKGEAISGDRQILQPSDDVKTASHSAAADDKPSGADGNSQPLCSTGRGIIQDAVPDSSLHEISCSTSKEVAGRGDAIGVNGLSSLGTSLSAGQKKEQNARLYDEEHNAVGLDGEKMAGNTIVEENCELLSEASVEVPLIYLNDTEIPIIEENNSVDSGSQHSFSMQPEPLIQGKGRPNVKRSMAGKTSSVAEKQHGRKVSRYGTRGRGRSRGN